jgi:putative restriction endonuclease
MHQTNPDIIDLANIIGRTPGAVAMKLVNFASLDPAHQQRNVVGLKNASRGDRDIFAEFSSDWEALAFESELAGSRIVSVDAEVRVDDIELTLPKGITERTQLVRVRTVQSFFRSAVMASYEGRCAMCAINVSSLLNASHIVPWSADSKRRADPTNGIALCALHDRAFDRGLISLDGNFKIVTSTLLRTKGHSELHRIALLEIEGKELTLPHRFHPDTKALAYHRKNIFVDTV